LKNGKISEIPSIERLIEQFEQLQAGGHYDGTNIEGGPQKDVWEGASEIVSL